MKHIFKDILQDVSEGDFFLDKRSKIRKMGFKFSHGTQGVYIGQVQ
jgi:hypothetical protein